MTASEQQAAWAQQQQQNAIRYSQELQNYINTPPGYHLNGPPTR